MRSNNSPWNYPIYNFEQDLTLHSMTRSLDTVLVDGRILVKNGRHNLIDEEVVYRVAQEATERILKRAGVK